MDDIFKRKESINKEKITTENIDVNNLSVEVKNKNMFKKVLNRIKNLFSKK